MTHKSIIRIIEEYFQWFNIESHTKQRFNEIISRKDKIKEYVTLYSNVILQKTNGNDVNEHVTILHQAPPLKKMSNQYIWQYHNHHIYIIK